MEFVLLKVSQAAALVGVRRERIYAAIRQGLLRPVPEVPYICLRHEEVIAFRDRRKSRGGRGKRACVIQHADFNRVGDET